MRILRLLFVGVASASVLQTPIGSWIASLGSPCTYLQRPLHGEDVTCDVRTEEAVEDALNVLHCSRNGSVFKRFTIINTTGQSTPPKKWFGRGFTVEDAIDPHLVLDPKLAFALFLCGMLALNISKRVLFERHRSGVPRNAEFLFYLFLDPKNCDALVGDLVERYKLIHKKFGRRRANFWYWWQTAISLGPIVSAWLKRVVIKPALALIGWAVAKGLVGHDGWLAALVEVVKKVRS